MAQFCVGCPGRGEACGELFAAEITGTSAVYQPTPVETYGVFFDTDLHMSKLLRFPDYPHGRAAVNYMAQEEYVMHKIDSCTQPAPNGTCQALGSMIIDDKHELPRSRRNSYLEVLGQRLNLRK